MSLADAVLEIAKEIEDSAESVTDNSAAAREICGWARSLRMAVKAAGGTLPAPALPNPYALSPEAQHFREIEKAKEEARAARRKAEAGEGLSVRFAHVEGQDAQVEIPGDAREGCLIALGGRPWRLEGNTLRPVEPPAEGGGGKIIVPG